MSIDRQQACIRETVRVCCFFRDRRIVQTGSLHQPIGVSSCRFLKLRSVLLSPLPQFADVIVFILYKNTFINWKTKSFQKVIRRRII